MTRNIVTVWKMIVCCFTDSIRHLYTKMQKPGPVIDFCNMLRFFFYSSVSCKPAFSLTIPSPQRSLIPPPNLRHRQPDGIGDVVKWLKFNVPKGEYLRVDIVKSAPRYQLAALFDRPDRVNEVRPVDMIRHYRRY